MKTHSIFPIPIYENHINRDFTIEEMNFVLNCEKHYHINYGNTSSANNFVLDEEPMADVKKFLEYCINEYLNDIVCPEYDVKIKLTQSWFNYTRPGQMHHKHDHPNSFISGVLYFSANPNLDKIVFYNPVGNYMYNLRCPPREYNDFNSTHMWFSNKKGKVLLFPSRLDHSVDVTESSETRISLAFNTFLLGDIGDDRSLTGLRI